MKAGDMIRVTVDIFAEDSMLMRGVLGVLVEKENGKEWKVLFGDKLWTMQNRWIEVYSESK